PSSPPPERSPLGFDELLAVVIAFLAIGSIFFWVLNRTVAPGFDVFGLLAAPATDAPRSTALPDTATQPEIDPSSAIVADQLFPEQTERAPLPLLTQPSAERPLGRSPQQLPSLVPVPVPLTPGAEAPATQGDAAVTEASPEAAPVDTGFSDVPSDYWAAPFIAALVDRGVLSGFPDGTFKPNQPVTRAEFAAMIESAFEQNPVGRDAADFEDVPADFWASPSIDRSYQIGFLEGYPGGVFNPNQQIPKVQALVALTRGLELSPPQDPQTVVQTYEDADAIPDYATNSVAAATESGLVVNYPNTEQLEPNQESTRAEIAALIYQAMVQAGIAEPMESDYVVQPDS
ncbi:S-layer homology domain-containing protein, partial [Oculatella sp. LEGE 06141]|uniref:S-layer homology domain-containing protein n=1 Tax=Oculatella sp. LEGE 06141 TaxID=1828648 RepID=UPI00187EC263